jgi:hypothetical protein
MSIDPLRHKYAGWSSYNYVMGNPLSLIDPTGMGSEWIPEVDEDGNITLQAEANDNLQTLQTFLKGSDYEKYASQIWNHKSFEGGLHVTLPSDNYSRAFAFAVNNPTEFSDRQQSDDPENYNCYHFAINGVWEKEIYSASSYGDFYMDIDDAQQVLNDFFTPVSSNKAIFGETIIGANYSKGFQHFMVYAGKDSNGNIYVMQKAGMSDPPNIIKMKEVGTGRYNDQKFFNAK